MPDPYDGLIPDHVHLKVHACAGLPLFAEQNLIGALTLDSLAPDQFDTFSDEELRLIAALAAGALNNALLIGQLENQQLAFSASAGLAAGQSGGQTDIIGLSPCMMQLKKEIAIVAGADMNVLVSGETGTGKELVVQSIHELSARRDHPLVYLNCAALPETVAESELFGHVKGAFTGAISNRSGKFEMADNGTLFLDEIGELSPALQAKLLRVLQYGDIQRIGDDRPLRVNVRVLAATNRDLRAEVAAGRFRADLFHRLSIFPLQVPPLRERHEDILLLTGYFCERYRQTFGLPQVVISPALRLALLHYHWRVMCGSLNMPCTAPLCWRVPPVTVKSCCYSLITSHRKRSLNRLSALKHALQRPIRICARPPIPFRQSLSALHLPAVTAAGPLRPVVSALMPEICTVWQNVWG